MSTKAKRYLCKECHREWIDPRWSNLTGGSYANSSPCTITGNPLGMNCPVCGSPEFELIEFSPQYPGLDIPREGEIKVIPVDTISTIPGLTGNTTEVHQQINRHQMAKLTSDYTPMEVREQIPLAIIKKDIEDQVERGSIYDNSDMD